MTGVYFLTDDEFHIEKFKDKRNIHVAQIRCRSEVVCMGDNKQKHKK